MFIIIAQKAEFQPLADRYNAFAIPDQAHTSALSPQIADAKQHPNAVSAPKHMLVGPPPSGRSAKSRSVNRRAL